MVCWVRITLRNYPPGWPTDASPQSRHIGRSSGSRRSGEPTKAPTGLFFELLWREFFRFVARSHGSKIFRSGGIRPGESTGRRGDPRTLEKWKLGRTADDFVNANMIELARTGWMSNRGRQNVASYLIHDLGQDWLAGARHFEELLIDYDPCSNYGNWMYMGGVGNDPRPNRAFNLAKQAEYYDPDGSFRKHWLG